MKPLNLASRPFRNETLPRVALALAAFAVIGLTVLHGLMVRGLRSASVSAQQREAAALEAEAARLRAEARDLPAPRPSREALAEWATLKDLVDRRSFSWAGLFAHLEAVLPPDVRLLSIAPRVRRGRLGLDLVANTRSTSAGLEFMRVLEAAEAFEDVYPPQVEPSAEGGRFTYSMMYRPDAPPPAAATAAPPEQPEPAATPGPAGSLSRSAP